MEKVYRIYSLGTKERNKIKVTGEEKMWAAAAEPEVDYQSKSCNRSKCNWNLSKARQRWYPSERGATVDGGNPFFCQRFDTFTALAAAPAENFWILWYIARILLPVKYRGNYYIYAPPARLRWHALIYVRARATGVAALETVHLLKSHIDAVASESRPP